MSTNKWIKRLRREATANPKKAAVLGLLTLVATYFWAPLVLGWISDDRPTAKPPVPAAKPEPSHVLGSAATAGTSADDPMKFAACPWQILVQWRKADPRTVATSDLASRRDPFHLTQAHRVEIVKAPEEEAPEPELMLTAQSLGLQLSSTIVGPRRSLAIISGKTYQLGQAVEFSREGTPLILRLAEVAPGRVVLQSAEQSLELTIPQRKLSGRLELVNSRD